MKFSRLILEYSIIYSTKNYYLLNFKIPPFFYNLYKVEYEVYKLLFLLLNFCSRIFFF